MNVMKRRMLAILAAVLVAFAIIVAMTCPAALAAEQLLRANGKHHNYRANSIIAGKSNA